MFNRLYGIRATEDEKGPKIERGKKENVFGKKKRSGVALQIPLNKRKLLYWESGTKQNTKIVLNNTEKAKHLSHFSI